MGFLKRLQGDHDPVPEWASVLRPSDYREFMKQTTAYFDRLGRPYEFVEGGGVNVQVTDGDPHMVGLMNLAQKWNLAPASERPAVIDGHLGSLMVHWQRSAGAGQKDRPFDEVASQLRLRLVPADYDAHHPGFMVATDFADGIKGALAIDWPDTVEMVNRETVEAWGIGEDELYARGLDNVLATERPAIERFSDGAGPLTLMYGDSFYTATHAVALDRYITPHSPHGAVFAVPNRHVVLLQPIRGVEIIRSIQPLVVAAAGYFREGPGSISPLLYWWRDREIVTLPCSFDGKQATFTPPDSFTELLKVLGEPA